MYKQKRSITLTMTVESLSHVVQKHVTRNPLSHLLYGASHVRSCSYVEIIVFMHRFLFCFVSVVECLLVRGG